MMQRRWRTIGAAVLATVGLVATFTAVSGQVKTAPFTFTQAQADRGAQVYDANCQLCHGAGLTGGSGGPPLNGQAFRVRWRTQPGDALFQFLREKMPPQSPGSLSDQEYADVMAYLVKTNGATPGGAAAEPAKLADQSLVDAWPVEEKVKRSGPTIPQRIVEDAKAQAVLKARAGRMQKLTPVTDEMLRNPPPGEWLHWRRTYDSHGFSDLDQVNRDNVDRLGVAWSWELAPGLNEITPLVHDGVLYVASSGTLQALDAATGDALWRYVRPGVKGFVRSLGIYGELLYFAADGNLVAVNMRDGKVVWDRQFADAASGTFFSSGPLVAKGKLFQGMSGCSAPFPGGCYLLPWTPPPDVRCGASTPSPGRTSSGATPGTMRRWTSGPAARSGSRPATIPISI
jgi:alcohol dehydrogenase (cytochrome c)